MKSCIVLLCMLLIKTTTILALNVDALTTQINQLKSKNVDISVIVAKKDTNIPLVNINAEKKMIPASLIKLLLTSCSLNTIGKQYRYSTDVFLDHKLPTPSLYIKGVGDPNHTLDDFSKIVTKLKQKKVHTINHIILDNSSIESQENSYGTSAKYYYAPYAALNFNYNQLTLSFNQKKQTFSIYPNNGYTNIDSQQLTFIHNTTQRYYPKIRLFQQENLTNYKIYGEMSIKDLNSKDFTVRIANPISVYGYILQQQLNDHNIQTIGTIINRPLDKSQKLFELETLYSPPFITYLDILNKQSNNMVATAVLTTLAKLKKGVPSSHLDGLDIVKSFLSDTLSLKQNTYNLVDGSGLSLENQIPATHIIKTINYAHNTFNQTYSNLLINIKGHQDYEDISIPEHIDIVVKSGTLSNAGVNNLAGIIYDHKTSTQYHFVIMTKAPNNLRPTYKGSLSKPLLAALIN